MNGIAYFPGIVMSKQNKSFVALTIEFVNNIYQNKFSLIEKIQNQHFSQKLKKIFQKYFFYFGKTFRVLVLQDFAITAYTRRMQ
jgi:hypothetical protein